MIEVTYKVRYMTDRYSCIDYERKQRFTRGVWMGNLFYVYRGDYVWCSFGKDELIDIKEV